MYSYYGDAWGAVEDLLQQFAEGLIAGVPAGSHPDLAVWLGHYRLFWGDWELVEGMNLYEDVRPINATFTLVYIPEPRRRGLQLYLEAKARFICNLHSVNEK